MLILLELGDQVVAFVVDVLDEAHVYRAVADLHHLRQLPRLCLLCLRRSLALFSLVFFVIDLISLPPDQGGRFRVVADWEGLYFLSELLFSVCFLACILFVHLFF